MVELSARTLVGPLEGVAGACGVVARYRTRCGVFGVVVNNDQTIDGVGVLALGYLLRPAFDGRLHMLQCGIVDAFVVDGAQSGPFQPVHACSPRGYFLVGVDQCERYPADMALRHLARILQGERSRSQVAGVGILLVALQVEPLKVLIRDDGLAAHHHMARGVDGCGNSVDGLCQVGDVGSDVSVATRHHLGELPLVVGNDQRQAVELPRHPNGAALCPFHQVGGLLGFRQ